MISETLQNARDYENKYGVFIQKEERPVFHATPKVGWMNDPNGFSVYQGKYHLFFQSHPYSNQWGKPCRFYTDRIVLQPTAEGRLSPC